LQAEQARLLADEEKKAKERAEKARKEAQAKK
jgi:hypothetical protein